PTTRLLLNYNNVSLVKGVSPDWAYALGEKDAGEAIRIADDLKVPDGVVIYADMEPTDHAISADWIVGWWSKMKRSRLGNRGGLYGNTTGNRWVCYLDKHFQAALKTMPSPGKDPALWSLAPPEKGCKPPNQIDFEYDPGSLPSQLGEPVLWQYEVNCYVPKE